MKPLAIAIESSCDDTSVALVRADGFVVHMVSENQDRAHQPFGGVVPEIAGRRHSEAMLPLIHRCLSEAQVSLEQIEAYIVTNRPGLIGSLIVGVVTAKSLALANQKKIIDIIKKKQHDHDIIVFPELALLQLFCFSGLVLLAFSCQFCQRFRYGLSRQLAF